MSELPPGPLPASELAAAEDDGLPSWPLPAPRVETAEDIRYERTFYRGALLRRIRTFARENGSLAAMFSVVFVNLVGFGIVVPLIPFFAQSLNAAAWQVTLMFTFYSLGQFFAEPLCGALSDRIGRKPILILTTALSTVFYLCLAFSPNIWMAIVFRFFSGLSSGNISTIQGYVADVSRPEQRSARMSMIGGAFSLGFIMGPFFGGMLTHGHSGAEAFRLPLIAAGIMSGVTALGVMLFIRESRTPAAKTITARLSLIDRAMAGAMNVRRTAHEAAGKPAILCVIAATLCYMGAFAGLESTFGLWAEARYGWNAARIGAIFPFLGVASASMQFIFMRHLVRRFGEEKVLAGGLFVFGLSFAMQALNPYQDLVIPVVMIGALGQAVIFSSICAIISLSTSPERQGAMLGFNMSVGAIARITGPVFAGFFFSQLGPDAPIWMGAAMTIPAALLALQAGRWRRAGA